jgi:hypothetical protein
MLATYSDGLIGQGFCRNRLKQERPSAAQMANRAELVDAMQRPTFLLVARTLASSPAACRKGLGRLQP